MRRRFGVCAREVSGQLMAPDCNRLNDVSHLLAHDLKFPYISIRFGGGRSMPRQIPECTELETVQCEMHHTMPKLPYDRESRLGGSGEAPFEPGTKRMICTTRVG